MQNKVLIVDGDTRSLRLLEVSLKQAGYRVGTATSGLDALGQLEVEVPDILLVDTAIGEVDGFALYARLQQRPEWAHLPFIFLLDGEDATQKLRAVQLGVSDFLTKPVFLKEALSRVELLLEKQAQRGDGPAGKAPTSGRARFAGALSGTALLDLLQTMELGRKSGIAYCQSGRGQRAVVYFSGGVVVDAELGRLRGTEALYRILTFQGGEYRVELLTVVRPARMEMSTPGLLMEAMRFLEEWNRLCAALPPLTSALAPATLGGAAGALRPEALSVELREVLQLFDGQRSVLDVLDILDQEAEPPHDLLLRLGAVAKLYAARLLTLAGRPVSGEPRAPVPTPLAVPRLIPPAARLTPPPLPRLTPPPLPRLTPPLPSRLTPPPLPTPSSRLTPPPLPQLTPPLLAGRAAALASSGRPTPVSLPRAVVKTPAPLSDSAAVTLPAELLITLVPGQPPPGSAGAAQANEPSEAATDEHPTPRSYPPAARPTPSEHPVVGDAARPLPPALPRAAGGATPVLPPAVASARPTPPPLPAQEAIHHTPAVAMAASPLPAPHSEAAHLKQTMRWSGQPTPLAAQETVRHAPAVPAVVSPPAPKPEAAHLKQTMRWSGQPMPTPLPAQGVAHPTAAVSPGLEPELNLEVTSLKQTMPRGVRLTPPPLPAGADRYTPAAPTAVSPATEPEPDLEVAPLKQTMPRGVRLTPPPLPAQGAGRYAPVVPTEVSSATEPESKLDAAPLKQTMPGGPRLTPPPLPAQGASRYTPAVSVAVGSGPEPEPHLESAPLKQTMPRVVKLTPPPLPTQGAGRYTPAATVAANPELEPEPPLEAAPLKQTMPRAVKLTPPPLPAQGAGRYTPAVPVAVTAEPELPLEAAPLKQTMPRGARLTPPPVPAREALHVAPAVSTVSAQLAAPRVEAAAPPPVVPASARPTPPPIPAREISGLTPAAAMASMVPPTPNAEEAPSAALASDWLTPPMPSFGAEPLEPEVAEDPRRTPPPFAAWEAARPTPVPQSRATPTPLPDETPTSVPLGTAAGASDSSAAPGNNLARLAQRLAATRQPLPFVAPSPPSSAGAAYASAPGNSEPGLAAAVQMTASSEASGRAVGLARGGSVPELEPISIPDFELMIEHSAPSWLPTPEEESATPGSELKENKTLPVQLRSQYRAAAAEAPAVHLSAPVLPAEPEPSLLPSIEVEVPPAPLLMLPPTRSTPATPRRWGKVVAWVIAGTALFSLGAGLYWVRQELDRGIALPGRQSAPPAAAVSEAPASRPQATRPPRVSSRKTSPAAGSASVASNEPAGAQSTGSRSTGAQPAGSSEPTGAQSTGSQATGAQSTGSQATGAQSAGSEPTGAVAPSVAPTAPVAAPVSSVGRPPAGAPAAGPASARPPVPPSSASPTGTVVAAAPPAVGSPADSAAGMEAAKQPVASGPFAVLIGKARAFEHRGALAAAYHAAHAAQRLQPRSAEVFALLAQLALDEGNADKAAGLAKRARYLDPSNAEAYLVLGTVEQARSRSASARTFFKKYLELAPNGERAVEVRAVLHSGR